MSTPADNVDPLALLTKLIEQNVSLAIYLQLQITPSIRAGHVE